MRPWDDIKEYIDSRLQYLKLILSKNFGDILTTSINAINKNKQDKLKAGKNITIKNNVISAKDSVSYSAGQNIKIDADSKINAEGYIYNAENNTIQRTVEGFFTISSMSDEDQEYYRDEWGFNWPYIYWVNSYEEKIRLYDLYDVPFTVKDTNKQIISENNAFSTPDGDYIFGTDTYLNPDTYIYSFINEVKNQDEIALGTMGYSAKNSDTWGSAGNTLFRVGTADTNAIDVRQNGDVYVQNVKIIDQLNNKVNKDKLPFKYNETSINYNVNYFGANNGSGTSNLGKYNIQEGTGNIITKTVSYSHMEGTGNTLGKSSGTEGTFGAYSHVEGNSNTIYALYGHAEGSVNTVGKTSSYTYGQNGHAEGYNNKVYGQAAHAEGNGTTAEGNYSHSEGNGTTAHGNYSHAEGVSTAANGPASHAECSATTAGGEHSHAEGYYTTTQNHTEHAEGRYNVSHQTSSTYGNAGNTQHSIGIGDENNSLNALEIMQNGDMYVYGVGGYDGTNPSSAKNIQQMFISYVPVGSILMWPTATPPAGWLICDGQSIADDDDYAALRTVLNANVVPDLSGRFALGASSTHALGSTGGSETVTLTTDEMPSHSHTVSKGYHYGGSSELGGTVNINTYNLNGRTVRQTTVDGLTPEDLNPVGDTETNGGGLAHENMPPYITLNFIIKYA